MKVRVLLAAVVVALGALGLATPAGGAAADDPEAGVRAAALKWEKVFLTGTPKQIFAMEGPECRSTASTTLPKAALDAYLTGERAVMRKALGVPLRKVPVRGVEVRDVTTTSGSAQVLYDLPETKVGNDNWVEFRLHRGKWLVANCHAPIGGHSSSSATSSVQNGS